MKLFEGDAHRLCCQVPVDRFGFFPNWHLIATLAFSPTGLMGREMEKYLKTSPFSVTAKQWQSPHAICLIESPLRAAIGCGIKRSLELPWPKRPKSPLKVKVKRGISVVSQGKE